MKIKILEPDEQHNGKLKLSSTEFLEIKCGGYLVEGESYPLVSEKEKYFQRIYHKKYHNKSIYLLNRFGKIDDSDGYYIGLNSWEKQIFLWLQQKHWLQKEENIRYIVNLVFLVIGAYVALKKL